MTTVSFLILLSGDGSWVRDSRVCQNTRLHQLLM